MIKETLQNLKMLSFLAIMTAMIATVSVTAYAQVTPGEEELTDKIGPVGNVSDAYLEVLKQQDFYLNMTSDEQLAYVQAVNEFRKNQDAYQREVQGLIEIGSQLTLDLQKAKSTGDADKIDELNAELFALMKTLETYGVVTLEELDKNPSFWAQQAKNASDAINKKDRSATSVCYSLDPDLNCGGQAEMYSMLANRIIPIHTDDVSLENKAYIWFQSHLSMVLLFIFLLGALLLVLALYRQKLKTSHMKTE